MDPLVIIHLRYSFVGKRKVQNTSPLPPNSGNFVSKLALISGRNSVVANKPGPRRGQWDFNCSVW